MARSKWRVLAFPACATWILIAACGNDVDVPPPADMSAPPTGAGAQEPGARDIPSPGRPLPAPVPAPPVPNAPDAGGGNVELIDSGNVELLDSGSVDFEQSVFGFDEAPDGGRD